MSPNEDELILPTATEYATGGLYAEDPRDWPIEQLYAANGLAAVAVFPSSFLCGALGPILNQSTTPRCVSFDLASVKMHQDYLDQGHVYPNFDTAKFAAEIGTTANGAYISSGLSRLKNYGYPVVSLGQEGQHKIAAYYLVPKTVDDLKSAVMTFGPLACIGQWYREWDAAHTPSSGVLPRPVTKWSGHSIELVGWNSIGFVFKQSWGPGVGASGYITIPYAYLFDNSATGHPGYLWAAYKTVDVIEYTAKRMACGAQIRPDVHFGASLGTIAAGTAIGVSGSVTGSTWTKTSACNPVVSNSGTKWYVVRTIAGQAVSVRFPGHQAVYVYAGAVVGG